jgi:hypothetical protein
MTRDSPKRLLGPRIAASVRKIVPQNRSIEKKN